MAVAHALADLTFAAGVAAASRAPVSVRDVLRADFLLSPRATPDAVLETARLIT